MHSFIRGWNLYYGKKQTMNNPFILLNTFQRERDTDRAFQWCRYCYDSSWLSLAMQNKYTNAIISQNCKINYSVKEFFSFWTKRPNNSKAFLIWANFLLEYMACYKIKHVLKKISTLWLGPSKGWIVIILN